MTDSGGQAPAERFDDQLCTARLIARCHDGPVFLAGDRGQLPTGAKPWEGEEGPMRWQW
jgi:hypothetical protein